MAQEVEGTVRRDEQAVAFMELYHATRDVFRGVELELVPYGVTFPQVDLLTTLRQEGVLSFTAVGRRLRVASQTVTGLVDRLEEVPGGGFVERRPDRKDRRKTWIALTPKGIALANRVTPVFDEALRRRLATLQPDEVRRLGQIIERGAKKPA